MNFDMDVTVCKVTECPKAEVKVGVESDKVKLDITAKKKLVLNHKEEIRTNKSFHALVTQEVGYEKLAFDEQDVRYMF
ncbi:hypothetical protein MKW98_002950 [Papaver atlanticum]|uniref:Uncharacterized protein n=1 Tax=Papaver atlanticum TaxID=357466 RepID=A0AAD4T0Z9_9MAGN|nr:hypothetical protein MKW98_002950 [Papaver atlanticum]